MRVLIFLLVFELRSLGIAVSNGVTPPLPVPSPDGNVRRVVSASQEETSCWVLLQGEHVVGINVSNTLTFKPNTFTVFFQNVSSGRKETVIECDLINNSSYYCDCGKGYTYDEKANAFYVVVNHERKGSDGTFVITINEEETKACSRDQRTLGPESNPAKPQEHGIKCLDAKKNRSADEDCTYSLSGGSPRNFQDENNVKGLAIELGLGTAVVLTVAIVAALLFLNRYRLRKVFQNVIVGTDNPMMSQNNTEVLVFLNPVLPKEAENIEIQEHADEENEKMAAGI